jgi:hypothetical protein
MSTEAKDIPTHQEAASPGFTTRAEANYICTSNYRRTQEAAPGVHRCDTDQHRPTAAGVLKSNQVQWSANGGAYVEVCGASSVRPTGFLTVPIAVSSRDNWGFRGGCTWTSMLASWPSRGKMSRRDQACSSAYHHYWTLGF